MSTRCWKLGDALLQVALAAAQLGDLDFHLAQGDAHVLDHRAPGPSAAEQRAELIAPLREACGEGRQGFVAEITEGCSSV
jgi:hypothetical protein